MSYLTDRCKRVVVTGKQSTYLPLHGGVPQGSILGPLLFLIYVNDMTTNLHLQTHQYADDTTLLEVVDDPVAAIQNINTDLHTLSQWADQWRVTFNAIKTHFMRISNKKTKPVLDKIILNGCQITEVDKYPNLGLIINNKLSWSDHAEHIIARASKKLTMLNRVSRHYLVLH